MMSTHNRADTLSLLIQKARKQGYLTVDEIIECVDHLELPIQDVDWITSTLTTRSVLIYDTVPTNTSIDNKEKKNYRDFAQSDYEALYNNIINVSPNLESFVNQIRKIIPPQAGEVDRLKYQVIDGNEHARQRMIEMHLRQAVKLAFQRAISYDIDLDELLPLACLGLIDAVDKFNPDISGSFMGYASFSILRSMEKEQPTKRALIPYSAHKHEGYLATYQKIKSFGCLGCESIKKCDKIKKIIDKNFSNVSSNDYEDIIDQTIPLESLDCAIEKIQSSNYELLGEDITYDDAVDMFLYPSPVDDEDIPFEIAAEESLKEQTRVALNTLLPNVATVLILRYGIGVSDYFKSVFEEFKYTEDQKEYFFECMESIGININGSSTLEAVGKYFRVTRERIRQIETKGLRILRSPKRAILFDGYVERTNTKMNSPEAKQQEKRNKGKRCKS